MRFDLAMSNLCDLFSNSADLWNATQTQFAYWCLFYKNLLQQPESPPDNLIDNDMALDDWLRQQRLKARQENIKNKSGGGKSERQVFHSNL